MYFLFWLCKINFNFQKHCWPTPSHVIQFNLIKFVFYTCWTCCIKWYVLRFYSFFFIFSPVPSLKVLIAACTPAVNQLIKPSAHSPVKNLAQLIVLPRISHFCDLQSQASGLPASLWIPETCSIHFSCLTCLWQKSHSFPDDDDDDQLLTMEKGLKTSYSQTQLRIEVSLHHLLPSLKKEPPQKLCPTDPKWLKN